MAESIRAESPTAETTRLLHAWRGGDGAALAALLPRVYDVLREIAAAACAAARATRCSRPRWCTRRCCGCSAARRTGTTACISSPSPRCACARCWSTTRAQAAAKRGGGAQALTLSAWDGAQTGADEVEVLALHARWSASPDTTSVPHASSR